MPSAPIFARIQPKSIKLTEKYKYLVQVSANQQASKVGEPSGKIEMMTPYDGKKHVTTQTIDDIKRQDWRAWAHETTNARIGYVSFANHEQTNLKQALNWNLYNVVPIEIPIKNKDLQTSDILLENGYACRTTHEYQPQWPNVNPINIDVKLYDEDIQKELSMDMSKSIKGNEVQFNFSKEEMDKIARLLMQQDSFQRSLMIRFELVLPLPFALGQAKEQEKKPEQKKIPATDQKAPQIERLAIEWPASLSHDLVTLTIDGKEQRVIYESEQGVITWKDISFSVPDSKSEGTDLYPYRAPIMLLSIDQPGDLYEKKMLKGEIKIKIPCALSGVEMGYFSANGAKSEVAVEHSTEITVDLELLLADCFERRIFSPYQQLQFEGVIAEEMRVHDIEYILRDLGFAVGATRIKNTARPTFLVIGLKQRELEDLRLWILMEGKPSKTMRERKIPGNQMFKTELEVGHTVLYIRGVLNGDSTKLVEIINTIQNKLREQFCHVSTTN